MESMKARTGLLDGYEISRSIYIREWQDWLNSLLLLLLGDRETTPVGLDGKYRLDVTVYEINLTLKCQVQNP